MEQIKVNDIVVPIKRNKNNEIEVVITEDDNKFLKYARQSAVRMIMYDQTKTFAEQHRTCNCLRRIDKKSNSTRRVADQKDFKHEFKEFYNPMTKKTEIKELKGNIAKTYKTVDSKFATGQSVEIYKKTVNYEYVDSKTKELKKHQVHNTFFNGLQVCGLLWTCPVCSSKISEKRKNELTTIIDQWIIQKHDVYMLTFTIPHKRTDDLNL